jgi:hypothetical protein
MNYRMSYRLRIRLAAEADVAEAAQWYNEPRGSALEGPVVSMGLEIINEGPRVGEGR